jgi:hypothetical protein
MFTFQLGSLHISKDISYDFNNFVSNSQYLIPTTSFQGKQWIVSSNCYCIVGDSLTHNLQETMLTPRTSSFVVKIMKEENDVTHILVMLVCMAPYMTSGYGHANHAF